MREKIYNLFTNPSDMTWQQILMNISAAAIIGFFIFISYFISHRGTIYSKKFNASFINQENTELKRKAEALQNKVDSFSRETEELKNQLMQMHKSIALVLSDIENQFALAEDKILKLQNAQSSENENDNKE